MLAAPALRQDPWMEASDRADILVVDDNPANIELLVAILSTYDLAI